MLDNLFTGTLLASLATLVVVVTATGGPSRPGQPESRAAVGAPLPTRAPGLGMADVRVLPATADAPMPIYQLPRVVVRGNVMREPALFADGAPGIGRPSAEGAGLRVAPVESR
jgi:hypothetical protein